MNIEIDLNKLKEQEISPQKPIYDKKRIEFLLDFYTKKAKSKGFDDKDKALFDKVVGYLTYSYLGISKRGLALIGGTGNGKTTAVELIGKLLAIDIINAEQLFGLKAYDQRHYTIAFNEAIKPNMALLKSERLPCPFDLIVDDCGREATLTHYGKKLEPIEELIIARYELWRKIGAKLLITSNLSTEAFRERYGERAYSRLNEMCTIVPCDGKDRRLIKGV